MTLTTAAAQCVYPTMPTLVGCFGDVRGHRATSIEFDRARPGNGHDRDRFLLARLVEGDLDALAEVFDHHGQALMKLATNLLGDASWADKVVYDTFLDAWEQIGSADMSGATLYQWLAGRVRRRAAADRTARH